MLQKTSDKSLRRDDTKSDARIAYSGKSPGVPALWFIAYGRRERSRSGNQRQDKKARYQGEAQNALPVQLYGADDHVHDITEVAGTDEITLHTMNILSEQRSGQRYRQQDQPQRDTQPNGPAVQ